MTPAEFRGCLSPLAWSQRDLARVLGLDDRLMRRWASGQNEIPGNIAHWLMTLATFHAGHPPPLKGKCAR
jgi:DNA-binding transcriptional regulator YiaG